MLRYLLLALLLPLLATEASASVIQPLTDAELVRRSDVVVAGVVVWTEVGRTPGGRVFTRAAVQVMNSVKGARVGEVLTVNIPGGKVGGLLVHVAGAPQLHIGDMAVGFLERHGDATVPMGLSFGWLPVRRVSGELRVFRDLDGLQLSSSEGAVDASRYVIAGVPLERFLNGLSRLELEAPPAAPAPSGEVLR